MSSPKPTKPPKSRKVAPGEYIKLGMRVIDTITGIHGIASYRARFIQGCDHIGIQQVGVDKDNHLLPIRQTDVLNVEILEDQKGAISPPNHPPAVVFVGDTVRDPLSLREGIVTAYNESLFEVPSLGVQPAGTNESGAAKDQFHSETTRVEVIKKGPHHGVVRPYSEYIPTAAPATPRPPGGPATYMPPQKR